MPGRQKEKMYTVGNEVRFHIVKLAYQAIDIYLDNENLILVSMFLFGVGMFTVFYKKGNTL